jgi:hypothetical protein
LIYKGADVNAQDTERGDTPLHLAIRSDEVELCALLVSKKADWDRYIYIYPLLRYTNWRKERTRG